MIVNCDVKGLEVVVAAWLSQDEVLIQELIDGVDIHGANQEAFNLPERVVAKVLKFRILYGGTEHGFVKDSDFTRVSTSKKYWANVIEKYYDKYKGIAKWHNSLLREVGRTGQIVSPFGRVFKYKIKDGRLPEAAIKNHIVQGTGADIVSIARVSLYKRWKNANIDGLLINTVHDSIVVDCDRKCVQDVVSVFNGVFIDLPNNINSVFNVKFTLPIECEIEVGDNQKELTKVA